MSNWKDDGLARPVEVARARTVKELGSIERAIEFRNQIKRTLGESNATSTTDHATCGATSQRGGRSS
jgi:hypothetical protein